MTAGTALGSAIVLAVCQRWPSRIRIWRGNTGAAVFGDQFVRFGVPGESDIRGILAPSGRFVAIEVKAGKDRMSDKQIAFRNMVLQFGGIHIIGRSVEQVIAEMEAHIR
jgi:hypothetical protein